MSENSYLIHSAVKRAHHFQLSLDWFRCEFENNEKYKDLFLKIVKEISSCDIGNHSSRQTIFIGVGKSADICKLIVNMLVSIGIMSRFIHATEAFHGELGVVREKDVIVAVSNSGKSLELLNLIPFLKNRKVHLFAVTSKQNSPFAQEINDVLLLPNVSEMCPISQAPLTSTITTLALFQLITAATMEFRKFSLKDYAINHPGGSIGKKIFIRVDDLMVRDEKLPLILDDISFSQLISEMTKFSKGAVVIVDKDYKMLGLITEKDLRVAMESLQKKVFDLKSRDIMNQKPLFLNCGTLAIDAMRFMTQRKTPLNVLPILNDEQVVVGLLHIQDLISAHISVDE